MSGERILLVEDDPDQRRLVSGLLAAEGYLVARPPACRPPRRSSSGLPSTSSSPTGSWARATA
ncbi:MAG TPA: hypothetical protein VGV61_01505 [Thermoanaerobaculia bacterium]|nr:hypothetical protein [Thermoanaerobaculia bacterium]